MYFIHKLANWHRHTERVSDYLGGGGMGVTRPLALAGGKGLSVASWFQGLW